MGVAYLAGLLPQGKVGLGPSTIHKNHPSAAIPESLLELAEVNAAFDAIQSASGPGSGKERIRRWVALLERATAAEQTFLSRLAVGELRQGALESLVADAVARATGVGAPAMRRAVMLSGSLPDASEAAATGGEDALARYRIELFRPLQPMLAQTSEAPTAALERLERAAFEYKLDGARIQVHRHGDEVRVYSRRLRDVTHAVPEVVEAARALPSDRAILDGEVLARRDDGTALPFQVTMRRFGRKLDVEAMRRELPLTPTFFDLLHLGGEDLIDRPTSERIEALTELVPENARIPRIVTADPEEANAFYERALESGHEGVMAKALDAPYQAGSRGYTWLKLKSAHTLDLVVLAAEWGSGRRTGWLSNLHLGARDPKGGFVMLGKTFKGMTDDILTWQTEALLAREDRRDDYTVYVRPELVVEVAFNDIQASPHYPAGLALRFARIRGYRADKTAAEADTIETVRALYEATTGSPA